VPAKLLLVLGFAAVASFIAPIFYVRRFSMNGRNNAARLLVSLGALVLIAAALLHLSDYPKDLRAVSVSNLGAPMQREVRCLFLLVGWDWVVIAITMMISAFTVTEVRKVIVLFCGSALLVTLAVMLALMGWFRGIAIILASALTILCGGLLFQDTAPRGTHEWSTRVRR
jgi:hypothetical protein